jgi:hypothetical protein
MSDGVPGGYSKAMNLTPRFQAASDARYKNYCANSTRRLRSAMQLGVNVAAGSDMRFNGPGKTRGEGAP